MKVPFVCQFCGKEFRVSPYRIRNNIKFCSLNCRNQSWANRPEALWDRIDKSKGPDACWPFLGKGRDKGGYRHIKWGGNKKTIKAHRLAYELTYGPIPEGLLVCHSCDVRYPVGDISYRTCCNPSHLWVGTSAENSLDAARKGRLAIGDRNGSRLHPERLVRGDNHPMRMNPALASFAAKRRAAKRGDIRGENHYEAKLTNADVREIFALKGTISAPKIAKEKGVSSSLIHHIWNGRAWTHITGLPKRI